MQLGSGHTTSVATHGATERERKRFATGSAPLQHLSQAQSRLFNGHRETCHRDAFPIEAAPLAALPHELLRDDSPCSWVDATTEAGR